MVSTKKWEVDSVRELSPEALEALKPDMSRPQPGLVDGAVQAIEELISITQEELQNRAEFKAALALRLMWNCLTSENAYLQWDYIQSQLENERLKDRIKLLEDELATREASNGRSKKTG